MDQSTFEEFNNMHLTFIKVNQLINEVIEEQNIDISREQLGVFKLLLKHKQLPLKTIAEKQGVFKTAISKRVKKLEEKGFVTRISSSDKREKVITLTDEGIRFYEERQRILYESFMKKLNLDKVQAAEFFSNMREVDQLLKQGEKNI
ncbi:MULTISPECIES: MarR family transcriptional regulator [unclassified Staphylococcus]|uniref:MarR family winged helix-turn-helix transcriptional regulator n=1 Tax=unclassified Staphylococcus TaxID=91994 RepID=UPI0021CFEAE2|nr:MULTISPECIES: MarR family transcriptional regulator [unclassified Staphylococcus]UXR70339.1 MarR family transcriptional regulator [Staphylococcus sp. IVB6246]UXR72405.1 MarR family transcriptional regulator [Staphylococcus sp. IVB6240]UXR77042.1 MarR family transcriptional regulator [Staphylococcus sp. IVB6233]UXR81167.1 MarR family transcriptional regulator [Staphylococcus sp. IVB6218]